jgi:hypothetical protein
MFAYDAPDVAERYLIGLFEKFKIPKNTHNKNKKVEEGK